MTTSPAKISISRRAGDMKPSATVAMTNRAKQMRREGIDVLSFAAGEPDFDTPEVIKQSAIKALLAGQTKYMPTMGDPETRAAIAEKVVRDNRIAGVTPEHVAISSGGKHGLYTICQCLFDFPAPGAEPMECLLPVPAWVSYAPLAELAGAKVVEIPTAAAGDFKMSAAQLKEALARSGRRARMLVLNSPSNPCGTMYTPDELRAIGRVVAEAARTTSPELVVVSDEIYEKIVYGGIEHFSIGSMPEIAERVITLNGLSKAYSMTGWRVGYATTTGAWGLAFIKAMATLQGQMTTNITSFVYPAIRTALAECDAEVERFREAFGRRAGLIHQRISAIPGMVCPRPTGAFYVFPEVSAFFGQRSAEGRTINSALEFCEALLAEAKVAAVPGEDFGGCGGKHVRFSFACSEAQITAGMDRLEKFIQSLR